MMKKTVYGGKKADGRERRVGINDRRGGSTPKTVGAGADWDDIREKRGGINNRRVGINSDKAGINSGRVGINLTQNRQKILKIMAKNPRVTMAELAETVGISTRKIEANVQKLKAMGLVERVGARKSGYWLVNQWA